MLKFEFTKSWFVLNQVITAVPAGDQFNAWKESGFAPEAEFLAKLESIDGITAVETQTYTFMPM